LPVGERIKKVEFWIDAYIPNDLENTITLEKGKFKGKTIMPDPGFGSDLSEDFGFNKIGYLDDQREGPSPKSYKASRVRSKVTLDLLTGQAKMNGGTNASYRIDSVTGKVLASSKANSNAKEVKSTKFTGGESYFYESDDVSITSYTFSVDASALNHATYLADGALPAIDYQGTLRINVTSDSSSGVLKETAIVLFDGLTDDFPSYEAYTTVN
jgi:hypothetical protein